MRPSDDEVAWATRVVQTWDAATSGAVALDGKMLDKPVVDHARRVLTAAGRAGQP